MIAFASPIKTAGLRVCHLGKYYPPARGGMETHLRTLARSQAALGAEVRVLCVNHEGRTLGATHDWDGPVSVTRVGRLGNCAGLDVCPAILSAVRGLRSFAPDILHLHTPNPTMLLPLVTGCSAPLVITHHSDIVRQKFLRSAHAPFERFVYDRAAAIVGTNPRSAGASMVLRRYLPKYGVLPLGLDLNPFLSPNAKARAAADFYQKKYGHPLWLSVGRLTYYKGFEIALAALREVPGRLLLVGEGPLEVRLKRVAAELGVGDRVTWLGQTHDDELVGAYHAADALWFPSVARSEGFGQVQVEAMASGCPVLNTDLAGSGVPWVSPHEETGLTVPVGNAPALATAARRLLGEPGLRERLAKAARQRAIAEFDHRTMGERSMAIYERARLPRR